MSEVEDIGIDDIGMALITPSKKMEVYVMHNLRKCSMASSAAEPLSR